MRKVFIVATGIIAFLLTGFFLIRVFGSAAKTNKAVLKVNSIPASAVFLNNQHVGQTPFEDFFAPGEYTLKLIPESTLENVVSWEGKVILSEGLLTFVNRELGSTELASAGELLTLEQIPGKKTQVVIVSIPDGAQVTINGENRGVTPLALDSLDAGEHEITVSALGSISRTVKVKVTRGYKLTAAFQLAVSDVVLPTAALQEEKPKDALKESTPSASPKTSSKPSASPTTLKPPYVEILDTPTGFLRVRTEPSTSATESGRVNPGEKFPLLDQENGWYQITFGAKQEEGWISATYAKKFE